MRVSTARQTGIYENVSQQKAEGATYTPSFLADFVAAEILRVAGSLKERRAIRIFDPAIGDGQLLDSLLERLPPIDGQDVLVCGYETNRTALSIAEKKLSSKYPHISLNLVHDDFLTHAMEYGPENGQIGLFAGSEKEKYDLIIANPPYVRTQIMGAAQSKVIAKEFGLAGRVDLYYAFIIGMSRVLHSEGVAGFIVSNRFMTTKSGAEVRSAISTNFRLQGIWDFGDTRIFDAAVLPAVLVLQGLNGKASGPADFTSIYSAEGGASLVAKNPIEAIRAEGLVSLDDGRSFIVKRGVLDTGSSRDDVWRMGNALSDSWLGTVRAHTHAFFGDIGKIRVGIKTTADSVFIRSNWGAETSGKIPELLRPLITHHVARQYKARVNEDTKVLYTHQVVNGKRSAVDISLYPNSDSYLQRFREKLESRRYVADAGRKWYEIWVPQDPEAWSELKLVFRDISERPMFWVDDSGAIVNGDCYWLISEKQRPDLIWLAAAVANSSFIESFYDYSFCNKLYAGRRRFITQYVEKFPLPDPKSNDAVRIISLAKIVYERIDSRDVESVKDELDELVWRAFGLKKESRR